MPSAPNLPGYVCVGGPYRGNYAEVFAYRHEQLLDQLRAVKVPYPYLSPDVVIAEAGKQMLVKSLYVVQILDCPRLDSAWCIAMEYCPHSLEEYLGKKWEEFPDRNIPYDQVTAILWGILKGMNDAHDAKLIHGDLKTGNILMDGGWTPKIADFGAARHLEKKYPSVRGSTDWMAPELHNGGRITKASDYFSFGVLAYLILTGRHPYFCDDPSCLRSEAHNIKDPKFRPTKVRKLRPDIHPKVARQIMRLFCRTKPPRIDAAETLKVLLSPVALPQPAKPRDIRRRQLRKLTDEESQELKRVYQTAQREFFSDFAADAAVDALTKFLKDLNWPRFRRSGVASLADCWSFVAYVRNSQGKYTHAVAAATKGIRVDERHVNSYHTRGYALIQLGRDLDAQKDLRKALSLAKDQRKQTQISRLLEAVGQRAVKTLLGTGRP